MSKAYQRIKVFIEAGELFLDDRDSIRRGNKSAVVSHGHLLHLPPDTLRIDAQKLRLLRDHTSSADLPQN